MTEDGIARRKSKPFTESELKRLLSHIPEPKLQTLVEQFMSARGKFFPKDLTPQDTVEFRSTWRWSDLTKIKAQQNLRGFVRSALRGEHRTDVLDALKTISHNENSIARRKAQALYRVGA